MPPEATNMITSPPPPAQSITSLSTLSAVSKHFDFGGGNNPRSRGDDVLDPEKMNKRGEITTVGNGSGQLHQQKISAGYVTANDHAASNLSDEYDAHDMSALPFGARNSIYHDDELEDELELDPQPSTQQELQQQIDDVGESQESKPPSYKEPLHKTLYDDFHTDLTSLREATIEALQLSCREQERLCLQGEELEARIAYMRKKITLARDELIAKGALTGGDMLDDNGLRLSLVKEGEEEMNASGGLGTLEEGKSTENGMNRTPSSSRFSTSRGALHGSLVSKGSKRPSMRSSLHGSQTTQLSKGSNISEATNMPHMSRSSLLGMLGASKNWLDNYAHTSSETDESTRGSNASFRISFMEGAGDGMPSRWRAREQEREKTAKQKEEEERRLQQNTSDNDVNGFESISNSLPVREKSKAEKLQDLIAKREEEISFLEKRTLDVKDQTSALQDEISNLEIDHSHEDSEYERDRRKLLEEITKVESDNSQLDHMLVETGVSLEEEKIIIEILANELKGAREQLAQIQNERDRLASECKKRKKEGRARRWSGWMRNSASSLLGLDMDQEDGDDQEGGQELQQQEGTPQSAQAQAQGQGGAQQDISRYQVPNDVLQQYQTLVNSSDDDTSADNLDPSGSGGSSGNDQGRGLDRRRSYASVGTCMSSLTLDSCELVDILEQLELDT